MYRAGHVSLRAPSLVHHRARRDAAVAGCLRALRALRGVSRVTVDGTSGAISVTFDPAVTTSAEVRARVRDLPRDTARPSGLLLATARLAPLLAVAARAALSLLPR